MSRKIMYKTIIYIFLLLTFAGPLWLLFSGKVELGGDYRTANRASAAIAPDPKKATEAIVQIYSARAFSWRGLLGTHNWIVTKAKDATEFTVYQVIGWRQLHGLAPLIIGADIPDRYWFGMKPTIILDIRGPQAEKIIPEIVNATKLYPYANDYQLWPGPNSNTFPAFIGRHVPELGLNLPADALGKDFLTGFHFFAPAPSCTGYQFSLFGIFGILVAKKEGIEINILGLVYGMQFSPFAIKLPGFGNLLLGF